MKTKYKVMNVIARALQSALNRFVKSAHGSFRVEADVAFYMPWKDIMHDRDPQYPSTVYFGGFGLRGTRYTMKKP